MCPATAPANGDDCVEPPDDGEWQTCRFGTVQCSCFGTWSCTDCPATQPGDSETCTPPTDDGDFSGCSYDDSFCSCFDDMSGNDPAWTCF